jgi:hypothetical protein
MFMITQVCSTCAFNGSCETQKKIAELRGWEYIGGCTKHRGESMEWVVRASTDGTASSVKEGT